jgi:hypothetical protein
MSDERRLGCASRLGVILLLNVAVVWPGTRADEIGTLLPLFPNPANACFTTSIPASDPPGPQTNMTSLIIRPQNPDTDGDGSFPPEVRARLEPERPDAIPLTLIATYASREEAEFAGRRWGARFSCEPRDDSDKGYQCGVADWCHDVEFDMHIESKDRIRIEVGPDAGSIGELGNPCGDNLKLGLLGLSQSRATYQLNRQPARMCR